MALLVDLQTWTISSPMFSPSLSQSVQITRISFLEAKSLKSFTLLKRKYTFHSNMKCQSIKRASLKKTLFYGEAEYHFIRTIFFIWILFQNVIFLIPECPLDLLHVGIDYLIDVGIE